MGGTSQESATAALLLFKQFLAERWFGGPEFDSWVRGHPTHEAELRKLRDDWLAELRDPGSPGLVPGEELALPSASALHEGQVVGGFRLRQRLGSGSSGEVWAAEELALGSRPVALKLLRPDLVPNQRAFERFQNEALAGASIHHSGVVAVYSRGRFHGQPYIAMELVEGGITLAAWSGRERATARPRGEHFRRVAGMVLQACEALGAVHAAKILHRDVKPANVLVTPEERLKLVDFGLARLVDAGGLSQTGDVMGTFSYMSPEQMRGEVHALDARTDVFSLGATFYELLTGTRAFPGESYHEIAQRILLEDPPKPRRVRPDVPRDLELVCMKALEKRPADRYGDMAAFADDLRRFLAGEPPLATSTTLSGHVRKWVRRHPTLSATAFVGLLGVVLPLWYRNRFGGAREDLGEALLASAQLSIEMGDLERARGFVEQHARVDPSDPSGLLLLAGGYAQQGRTQEADRMLELARARGFREDPAEADTAIEHLAYGLYLRSRRDFALYPEIRGHLARALELDPGLFGLHFVLYQMALDLDDTAGAEQALAEFARHVPAADVFHDVVTALLAEVRGDAASALETMEALRRRPDMDEARLGELSWHRIAGRLCVRLGRLESAEEHLREAVTAFPGDCRSWEALAVLHYQHILAGDKTPERRERLRAEVERAGACSASLVTPHVLRAWLRASDFVRATGTAEREAHLAAARAELATIESLPGVSEAMLREGRRIESFLLQQEGLPILDQQEHAAAHAFFARAQELDPENLEAAALFGQTAWWTKEHAAGLAALERALARWDDPDARHARDSQYLAMILVWMLGNAGAVSDANAFAAAHERFQAELERGMDFPRDELLNAAEFLSNVPEELKDCELAWRLLEEHGLREAYARTQPAILARIEAACP